MFARDLNALAEGIEQHGAGAIGNYETAYNILIRAYGLAALCHSVVRCGDCPVLKGTTS